MQFVLFLTLTAAAVGLTTAFDIDTYKNVVLELSSNPLYRQDFKSHLDYLLKLEPDYFEYTPFNRAGLNFTFDCKVDSMRSTTVPSSVHALRPGDVKVVGAMGDSITAALGANARTIPGILFEFRGRSWSIGGQSSLEKVVTMPNILKKFNPDLRGFSTHDDLSLVFRTGVGLNAAVSGQESNHIPAQARYLVERMREHRDVDFENDWKMVTLFVGGNDLCRFCKDPEFYSPENYVSYIREALDYLQESMPRTFVNLVQVVNVTDIREMNRGLFCSAIHKYVECSCGAYPDNANVEAELQRHIAEFHSLTQELVASGRYDKREDFTVVVQPFYEDFQPPRLADGTIDFSYLAPDCFHFSPKGHALAAIGLWNNMLQPVGAKSTAFDINVNLFCPSEEHPYLFTSKNSN